MTAKQLAILLYEELERNSWGDIDPYWIQCIAQGVDMTDDCYESAVIDLREVLTRVADRIVAQES